MALKKSSVSLDSSSDAEELPVFTFLKKEPCSTERRQPPREEKIVVVHTSDSEASCPPSPRWKDPPPAPDTAETITPAQPVRVLSSGSEDEEELIPLAERLACKFLTHKQLSPEDPNSPVKSVLGHRNTEGASRAWEKLFPKICDVPLQDPSERRTLNNTDSTGDSPGPQVPAFQATCPLRSFSSSVTKPNAEARPAQKRTKHSPKVQRRGSQGRARGKESTLRPPPRDKKAAPADRPKAPRPEECLKHVAVALDPGPPSTCLRPVLSFPLPGPPADSPLRVLQSSYRWEAGASCSERCRPWSAAVRSRRRPCLAASPGGGGPGRLR